MDFITIGGTQYRAVLKYQLCNSFCKAYNILYSVEAARVLQKYDSYLTKIKEIPEEQSDKRLSLIDEYLEKYTEEVKLITLPLEMIYLFGWGVLADDEKAKFGNDIEKMKDEVLIDELQPMSEFVGEKILRLQGYKKKLNLR